MEKKKKMNQTKTKWCEGTEGYNNHHENNSTEVVLGITIIWETICNFEEEQYKYKFVS